MRVLRNLILVLMTVAVLPWAAYVAASVATQTAARMDQIAITQDAVMEGTAKLIAPPNCRGSFVLGEPCTPDLVLTGDSIRLGLARTDRAWPRAQDGMVLARSRAPPTEPPRRV